MLEQQMSGRQELPEQLHRIGKQILLLSRNELYLKMRFLDVALSSCPFVLDEGIGTIGTDGLCFYYEPRYLGGLFREDQVLVNRAYLHMVLHGIFKHMARRGGRDERLYGLACDIAAESVIDGLRYPCVLKSRSWLRRDMYRRLSGKMKVLTAEKIYGELLAMSLSEREIERLEEEFVVDSHLYWPSGEDKKKQEEIENRWKDISEPGEVRLPTVPSEILCIAGRDGRRPGQLRLCVLQLWPVALWEHAPHRAARMERSAEDRGVCHCHRHVYVLFGRAGEEIFGADVCCSDRERRLLP